MNHCIQTGFVTRYPGVSNIFLTYLGVGGGVALALQYELLGESRVPLSILSHLILKIIKNIWAMLQPKMAVYDMYKPQWKIMVCTILTLFASPDTRI